MTEAKQIGVTPPMIAVHPRMRAELEAALPHALLCEGGKTRGIIERQSAIYVAGVFSAFVNLSLTGLALNATVQWIGARFVFWARREHSPM